MLQSQIALLRCMQLDTTGCYGMPRDATGCHRMLRDATGCYGMLQDATGCYGMLRDARTNRSKLKLLNQRTPNIIIINDNHNGL